MFTQAPVSLCNDKNVHWAVTVLIMQVTVNDDEGMSLVLSIWYFYFQSSALFGLDFALPSEELKTLKNA